MSYFPDLSPYDYGKGFYPGVVHVGWLDRHHDYPKGSVPREIVKKLQILATQPVELYMGYHECELCVPPAGVSDDPPEGSGNLPQAWVDWIRPRSSNGEIRVTFEGVTYAAPVLIVHNIEEHCYLPPAVFLQAVMEGAANRPLGFIRKLPDDMLVRANLDSDSPAWRLSDFAQVLQRATAHGLVCLGGQFEFRGPHVAAKEIVSRVCGWSRSKGQGWDDYVEFANAFMLDDIENTLTGADLRALALGQKSVAQAIASAKMSNPSNSLYFAAQFGRDPVDEIARSGARSQLPT